MNQISPLRRAVGLMLTFVGFFWVLIGGGVLQESSFSGQTWLAVVGGVLAVAGVWITTRKPKPPVEKPSSGEDAAA